MATTVFVNGVTLTDAGWFNDADSVVYDGTTSQVLVGGGAGSVAVWTAATGTGAPVRAASPTLSGTVAAASGTFSGTLGVTGVLTATDAVYRAKVDAATLDATPRTVYTLTADIHAIYLITASCTETSGNYAVSMVITTAANSRTIFSLANNGITFSLSGADIQWVAPGGALTSRFTILRLR